MKLSLVVPTYREEENIRRLIEAVGTVLSGREYEIMVVDDNSPDKTVEIARGCAGTYPVNVIVREEERGLGTAIMRGFREATGDIVGVIDADLQHPPEVLPRMMDVMAEGVDIVVASRYTSGGGVEGWSAFRRLISGGATMLARPLTPVKDPMSGCFMMLRALATDNSLGTVGYKILLEILVKAPIKQSREVPYIFGSRQHGNSKLGKAEYIRYLKLLWQLYRYRFFSGHRNAK